jgi:16S rRNA (cytosine1402-N4)-methyltransferase
MQYHKPVLLQEALEILITKTDGIYADATIGFGGHSREILDRLDDKGRLIGIDRDEEALSFLRGSLSDRRLTLLKGSFSDLASLLMSVGLSKVDGVLFDLGVSLFQLKKLNRGFSFISDSRLDMRMDASQTLDAWEIVNRYSVKDLERIFRDYGEEPASPKIARAIVEQRRRRAINTCRELAAIVERVCRRRGKTHPATKSFQAIRIEVNDELGELRKGLSSATESLKAGGKVCVISYHSLEDRIVKDFFKEGQRVHKLKILTKKPVIPSKDELMINPSSRSAKLRGAEKV